eukprot:TRINITY_DN50654_c0_g1_i1.p3 TRINITY_DN50654_c0_g1~~TRINITY_DN50654_c0_g1_i1.p3  ORF type:complete len:127 (+),score=40.08 TRINITY_DN50654_c0_g1_i1:94-474(+)
MARTLLVAVAAPCVGWFLWDYVARTRVMNERWWPVVSWFKREWKKNPAVQQKHLKAFVNVMVFLVFVHQLYSDEEDAGLRNPTPQERSNIERGLERMMHQDYERHAHAMDVLMHKHKVAGASPGGF